MSKDDLVYRSAPSVDTSDEPFKVTTGQVVSLAAYRLAAPGRVREAADIYPAIENADDLGTAIKLVSEAFARLASAEEIADSNPFAADNETMHVMALLPELFILELGNPFSMVISSIHYALHNLKGEPLATNQRTELQNVFRALLREPYLSESTALDLITDMENVGLNHLMPEMDYLAEVLIDASHRTNLSDEGGTDIANVG